MSASETYFAVRDIAAALEKHGVGLRKGMAIYAIIEDRFDDAENWLDALRAQYRTPAAIVEQVVANPPAKPKAKPGPKPKLKPPTPAASGNPGHVGQTRVCTGCGERKGVTAFKAGGGTLCKLCRAAKGQTTDPGITIVRCLECGKGYPTSQINGDRLCERCAKAAA